MVLFHPFAGGHFQIAHQIGNGYFGVFVEQYVDMIWDAADPVEVAFSGFQVGPYIVI